MPDKGVNLSASVVSTLLGSLIALNVWVLTSIVELKVKVAANESKIDYLIKHEK